MGPVKSQLDPFNFDGNRLYQTVGTYWDPNQLELPKDKTNPGKGNGKGNENGSDNGNGKNKIQAFSFSFLDRSITLLTMSNGVGNGNGNGNSYSNNGNGQGNGNGLNQKDKGKQLGPVKEKLQKEKGNRGKHLGWYKRADHPKNPGKLPLLNEPDAYEIVNYVNDVSQENPQVLMTSDQVGTYRGVYTYGLERIAERDSASIEGVPNDPLYYLYDGHNSVTQLINSAGNVRDKYRYDAYGDPMPGGQLSPNTRLFNNPFGYNGEAHDLNSGLQYLRDRYYDPNMGRFTTRDSYLGNIMKPLSLNRYAYTGNNPVMYADPSGQSWDEFWQKTKQVAQNVADTVIQGANYLGEKLYEGAQVVKQEAVAFYDENIAPAFNKYVAPVIRGVQEKVATVAQVTQATQANLNLAKDIMKNPTAYSDADFANMGPLGPTMKRLVKIKTFSCGDAPKIAAQKALDYVQTGLDIGGLVPGFGEPIDGVNGLIYLARGDKLNAGLSLGAMIPFLGDGVTGAKLANKGLKAAENTAEVVKDINKGAKITEGASKAGWRVGDDIYSLTAKGNSPSWSTVRQRFWKNEGTKANSADIYGAENIDRLKKGLAPQRYNPDKGAMESMELSHEPIPFRDGGRDFVPRWPQDHAAVDPFRHPGY